MKLKNITDETRFLCRNQVETKHSFLLRDEIMQRIDKLSEKKEMNIELHSQERLFRKDGK